jgi:hypothetical protein
MTRLASALRAPLGRAGREHVSSKMASYVWGWRSSHRADVAFIAVLLGLHVHNVKAGTLVTSICCWNALGLKVVACLELATLRAVYHSRSKRTMKGGIRPGQHRRGQANGQVSPHSQPGCSRALRPRGLFVSPADHTSDSG